MIPKREHARNNDQTYFVTSSTWERRSLFRSQVFADLFIDVLNSYRGTSYLLHEFVLMPELFHLLISPNEALERSVQKVKGGFSFRAKRQLGSSAEIWQRGFSDHRVRDWEDYKKHRDYLFANPVTRGLCFKPEEYVYSSCGREWDDIPQRLKPPLLSTARHG